MIVDVDNGEVNTDDVKQVGWTDDDIELQMTCVLPWTQRVAVYHRL